jgi:hypothetical protein
LVRAHGISAVSSDTRTNSYANYARSVVDLVLSAAVTLGMFLHNGRQGSVLMNWALPGEVQNPVPTSGRPIPPCLEKAISDGDTGVDIYLAFSFLLTRTTMPNDGHVSGNLLRS